MADLVEVDIGGRFGVGRICLGLGFVVLDELVDDLGADEQVKLGLGGACGRVEAKESVRRERGASECERVD